MRGSEKINDLLLVFEIYILSCRTKLSRDRSWGGGAGLNTIQARAQMT